MVRKYLDPCRNSKIIDVHALQSLALIVTKASIAASNENREVQLGENG